MKAEIRSGVGSAPQAAEKESHSLDPVTFEVLKNSFVTAVDLMAEQMFKTCHSFVIYAGDFSSAICDAQGNTVMQGSRDCASHVGTLHYTAKAILEAFEDDLSPGDVFVINDPYLGGTHFSDVRVVRPVFYRGELIALAQTNGHWADVGGRVPGSFDVSAKEHFGEGLRIPPLRICDKGQYRQDAINMIVRNMRIPSDSEGDLYAQVQATAIGENEILRLVEKYGRATVLAAFAQVQDYVETVTRQRVRELPDGTWETEDYLDSDPALGEGLIPIRVRLTIHGDSMSYDLTGSHPAVSSFLNSTFGGTFSAVVAGTKYFFHDIPLNSGFYRTFDLDFGPQGTVVNANWPVAVTGFCSGPYEKLMSSVFELWSELIPERSVACAFNLEYLLVGGRDGRSTDLPVLDRPVFMWYDWMVGGWGGRHGRDGQSAMMSMFAPGNTVQPLEGQEALCPVRTTEHTILPDSAGPGRYRGGFGVNKGIVLTEATDVTVSYCCDRARAVTWGLAGGLPSLPHGAWLEEVGKTPQFVGAVFSNLALKTGDRLTRPAAGGGGFGDPLERDVAAVCEDVTDGYVTIARAKKDYGVIVREVDAELCQYEVDEEATAVERQTIRGARLAWLKEDPGRVAERYRAGELDVLDVVRQYGVILDWGTGQLLPKTTETFRAAMVRRSADHWI